LFIGFFRLFFLLLLASLKIKKVGGGGSKGFTFLSINYLGMSVIPVGEDT